MAEQIIITGGGKVDIYNEIIPQIESVVEYESDLIANLSNITAILREAFGFFWVGFYLVKGDELVLGPFQGTLACTRIKRGRGVCGSSWSRGETIVVEDVEKFDGHIACSSASKSEVVVPIFVDGTVVAVIDVDSDELSSFDNDDAIALERIAKITSNLFTRCEK